MKYEIEGMIAQSLRLELDPGQGCWASKGSLVRLSDGIDWRLRIPGGIGGAMKRKFAGEGAALAWIEFRSPGADVVLGANEAGRITTWDIQQQGTLIATRGAFLAAVGAVNIDVTIARRASAMFFGGAGLLLQKMSGAGTVFIHGAGDFMDLQLAAGQRILVSTGNLAAFSDSIDYRIRGVGSVGKVLFSGEGLFMTELTGPGRVLLQTLKRRRNTN